MDQQALKEELALVCGAARCYLCGELTALPEDALDRVGLEVECDRCIARAERRLSVRVKRLAQRLDVPGYPWYVFVLDVVTGWLVRWGF